MSYFCVYPVFQWGDTVGKVLPKAGVQKNKEMGTDSHIAQRFVYRSGFKPSVKYDIERLKGTTLEP